MFLTTLSLRCVSALVLFNLTPPNFVGVMLICGGLLFKRIPTFYSYRLILTLCYSALVASSTIKTISEFLATAITCLPLPLPSAAPSIIPGRSNN